MNEFILDGAIYYNAKDVNDTILNLKHAILNTNLIIDFILLNLI